MGDYELAFRSNVYHDVYRDWYGATKPTLKTRELVRFDYFGTVSTAQVSWLLHAGCACSACFRSNEKRLTRPTTGEDFIVPDSNSDSVILVLEELRALFFLFLAYSGLVYAAGSKKNEKKTH